MRYSTCLIGLAAAALPLAGCASDYGYGYRTSYYDRYGYPARYYYRDSYRPGYSVGIGFTSYPYDVWYDDYYGPFYDGYWGSDGYFYFRASLSDSSFRRGDPYHFRHEAITSGPTYRLYQGETRQPAPDTVMPNYPRRDERGRR